MTEVRRKAEVLRALRAFGLGVVLGWVVVFAQGWARRDVERGPD